MGISQEWLVLFEWKGCFMYPVSEANRRLHCLELKVYDDMLRFEKSFNGSESVGMLGAFLEMCCNACGVEMENTKSEIEDMPNRREAEPEMCGEEPAAGSGEV